ncbi:hypothetical protein [Bradyrhizobium sp. SBR1B]|uniref:hypothetical protein n=1 Tax=Bradyrhizobium sp. SBR1B TaxID=2663836 RepID=UPI0016056224|nr:hypothetical protein [Bradyrhizobium sp. SBR1B]MBB4377298.1 hypothetical protein [Bradyrhizobium sp. SBR1B]
MVSEVSESSHRKLDWVRNEIERMRGQLRAQEREIRMLQRAGVATASAELLLTRMRARVEDLCGQRDALRKGAAARPREVEMGQSEPPSEA